MLYDDDDKKVPTCFAIVRLKAKSFNFSLFHNKKKLLFFGFLKKLLLIYLYWDEVFFLFELSTEKKPIVIFIVVAEI